jgi:FKBP-type peptidyl-prolyl cis-trans isomerase FklB
MNQEEGSKFLSENAQQEGVVSLPSGLQYKVIETGEGDQPGPSDVVKVHYEGRLINGKVFDSSYKRGEPATFPVNGVIKGWTEALQLMKIGSQWELYVPAELGYGTRGTGADIGPNSTLIFKVELLDIHR